MNEHTMNEHALNEQTRPSRRFLMPMWEGGGTVPPELGVARRLIARGHTVHVLADPTIESAARSVGCGFTAWSRAPHRTTLAPADDLLKDWEIKNPLAMLKRVRDEFIGGPAARFAADTAAAIDAERPDAVVTDSMLFGSVIAAQAASLPVVGLVPNIWMFPTRGTPSIGPGFPPAKTALGRARDASLLAMTNRLFRAGLPALDAARAEHGLPPLRSFYDQILGADRLLVLSSPEFDYAAPFVPPNVRYVGPVLDDPSWAEPWVNPWSPDDDRPLVLVGFSSTYQQQGAVLQRVVDALAKMPVRAIVTLGQMLDDAQLTPTPDIHVVRSAPHAQILPMASAVITHCGHGTTMKSLAAGLPMVCMPMGRDQNDTAARVVHHGAGVRLSPSASVAKIERAIGSVLGEQTYRANARRLGDAIEQRRGCTDVVDEIESVIALPHAVDVGGS